MPSFVLDFKWRSHMIGVIMTGLPKYLREERNTESNDALKAVILGKYIDIGLELSLQIETFSFQP